MGRGAWGRAVGRLNGTHAISVVLRLAPVPLPAASAPRPRILPPASRPPAPQSPPPRPPVPPPPPTSPLRLLPPVSPGGTAGAEGRGRGGGRGGRAGFCLIACVGNKPWSWVESMFHGSKACLMGRKYASWVESMFHWGCRDKKKALGTTKKLSFFFVPRAFFLSPIQVLSELFFVPKYSFFLSPKLFFCPQVRLRHVFRPLSPLPPNCSLAFVGSARGV